MLRLMQLMKKEYAIFLTLMTYGVFLALPQMTETVGHFKPYLLLTTCVVFMVMLMCSFNIVKHADCLAEKFGEPYGTLILTLSVISIEVALILNMMLSGNSEPTLARDTMLAVIMIAVNGFAGLSLLIGGIKHGRQSYNIQGASSYVAVLICLVVISMILPNFTASTSDGSLNTPLAMMVIVVTIVLYVTFLVKQTITHRDYFQFSLDRTDEPNQTHDAFQSVSYHIFFLIAGLLVMIFLSKYMAVLLDASIAMAGLPMALGGVAVALLVLLPEGISAIQAAYQNKLQRSINLCMGSAVATICLTVPAILLISIVLHQELILGLSPATTVLMILTFFISLITFSSRHTSVLNGAIFISIFVVYIALIFDVAEKLAAQF